MYIAKLFSTATMPVSIISISSKNILDAKRCAISIASDFNIPGYDAIRIIEIYSNDTKIDTFSLTIK